MNKISSALILSFIALFAFTSLVFALTIEEKHQKVLYPIVRVRTSQAMGSGTILYSQLIPGSKDKYETYVLTNKHVISYNIKIAQEWSTLLKREVKTDILTDAHIDNFEFDYLSWKVGHSSWRAQIMAYDHNMDLGLLRIKTERQFPYVAQMFPRGQHKKRIRMFMELYAVGSGLGEPTLATDGHLTGFGIIIQNYPYWLSTAPTIFGNSGGAVFLVETGEFIGVPSRIAVTWGGDAITHMSYFIPITSIYRFLDEQIFQFIYDSNYTSEQCAGMRRAKRYRDEKEMAIKISREEPEKK